MKSDELLRAVLSDISFCGGEGLLFEGTVMKLLWFWKIMLLSDGRLFEQRNEHVEHETVLTMLDCENGALGDPDWEWSAVILAWVFEKDEKFEGQGWK